MYFISVSSFFRVFLVLFGGWYRVSYLRKVFPSIFLRMELCGPFFPSISWGFYCVASAYMRLVCRSIFLGMVLCGISALVFPGIFLGMVFCGISAPSFPRYFPGMVLCGISAPFFPKYFPGDGIVWHNCA